MLVVKENKHAVFFNSDGILSLVVKNSSSIVSIRMILSKLVLLHPEPNLAKPGVVKSSLGMRGFGPKLQSNPFHT